MSQVQVQPLFRKSSSSALDDSMEGLELESKGDTAEGDDAAEARRRRARAERIAKNGDDYEAWYNPPPSSSQKKSDGVKTSSSGADDSVAKRIRKKRTKRTSNAALMGIHHRQADFPRERLARLWVATEDQASAHPHLSEKAVNVSMFVLFKKLRGIDPKQANADVSFILSLRWCAPELCGSRIEDMSKLWTPKIGVINADKLKLTPETPWFYPDTGDVRMIVHCDGTVANESDLRTFPFDHDDVRIFIAAEIGTGDRYVRLHWQNSDELEKHDRSASAITPAYVGTQNMEWDLVKGGNSVVRVPLRHNVTGHYTAIEVQLRLTRRYGFYLWKIMLLVWMIACMSWSTFLVKGENGRIDAESFIERLNYTAALLLAAVSFLYISQESIPRLSYLTSLDTMILFSFFNLFGVMVETVVVKLMSQMTVEGEVPEGEVANSTFTNEFLAEVDMWGLYISAGTFHLVEVLIPIFALVSRWRMLRKSTKWGAKGYIDKGLLVATKEEEAALREGSEKTSAGITSNNGDKMSTERPSESTVTNQNDTDTIPEKIDSVLKPESDQGAMATGYNL